MCVVHNPIILKNSRGRHGIRTRLTAFAELHLTTRSTVRIPTIAGNCALALLLSIRSAAECEGMPSLHLHSWHSASEFIGRWNNQVRGFSPLLSREDSNLEFQNQNLTCYHYTMAQEKTRIVHPRPTRRELHSGHRTVKFTNPNLINEETS